MVKVFDLRLRRLEKQVGHRHENYDFSNDLFDEIWLKKLLEFEATLAQGKPSTATWGEDAEDGRQAILDQFKFTADLRSKRREYPRPGDTYEAAIKRAAARWAELGGKAPYVPALTHWDNGEDWIERDGFDFGENFFPDCMERRAALWAHPRVKEVFGAVVYGIS